MKSELLKKSAEMVIMDAIEKGHTEKAELIEYMKSETFEKATKRYYDLFSAELN